MNLMYYQQSVLTSRHKIILSLYGFNSLNFCEYIDTCRESASGSESLLTKEKVFNPWFGFFFYSTKWGQAEKISEVCIKNMNA